MDCICKLIGFENNFEDGLILECNGIRISCFFSYSPFALIKGNKYRVTFEPEYLDHEMEISEIPKEKKQIEMLTTTFSYQCSGVLVKDTIYSVIPVVDECFNEMTYLQLKNVTLYVERLSVIFLSKI